MAKPKQELVDSLKAALEKPLGILAKELSRRPEWGTVTFEEAELDLKRAKDVLGYLRVLPIEALTDNATTQITNAANSLTPVLEQMDQFTIVDNAITTRNTLVQQLHSQVDNFYAQASPWIPFLAYQKGDVSENIAKLSDGVEKARSLVEKARLEIESKRVEMDAIIAAARAASASAGAAVFTSDFENESSSQGVYSQRWLIAAGVGVLITIIAAAVFWVIAHTGTEPSTHQLVQEVVAKLIILSMLVTATAWCGRNYKALKHLSALNRHRSLSLRTLQAFSAAASDDQTKNAVLLEATRAVFSAGSTGYLDGGSGSDEAPMKVIEIAKTIASKK